MSESNNENKRGFVGFTMDLRKLGAWLRHDPSAAKEILEGLKAADVKPTDPLGAAAMKDEVTGETTFYTLFGGTLKAKKPGEAGYFQRNDAQGGKGDRVRFRLREQEKKHAAAAIPADGAMIIDGVQLTPEQVKAAVALAQQQGLIPAGQVTNVEVTVGDEADALLAGL